MMMKSTLKIGENVTGQALEIPVYRLGPNNDEAPKCYLQASIHGAEVQGNLVIHFLLKALQKLDHDGHLKADVTLVPFANPIGMNNKNVDYTGGRFDPVTGDNWNRLYHNHLFDYGALADIYQDQPPEQIKRDFRQKLQASLDAKRQQPQGLSTGQHMTLSLQDMAHQADFVLDLHTGPQSCRHLYAPSYALVSAAQLPIRHILSIPNSFDGALDEASFVPWWSLSNALGRKGQVVDFGVEAFTLELGSQERLNSQTALDDCNGILAWMEYKGLITARHDDQQDVGDEGRSESQIHPIENYITLYSPVGGLAEFHVKPGEKLVQGQKIATILNPNTLGTDEAEQEIFAPFDGYLILHFDSASLFKGAELYKMVKT